MMRSALRPAGRAFPSAVTATLEIDATLLTVKIGCSDFDRDRPILTFTRNAREAPYFSAKSSQG